jgi:hypothetical protein
MYKNKTTEGGKRIKKPLPLLYKGKWKTCKIPQTYGPNNQQRFILNTWNEQLREEN